METPVSQRLEKILQHTQLSQRAFAERLGTSDQVVSNWKHDRQKMSDKFASLICDRWPELSYGFVKGGVGSMLKSDMVKCKECEKSNYLINVLREQLKDAQDRNDRLNQEIGALKKQEGGDGLRKTG